MPLGNVIIKLANGALGGVPASVENVAGMVLSATATAQMPLLTPKVVYTLKEAVGLGLDATTNPSAYRQITEFYDGYRYITGRDVAELYLLTVANTVPMEDMMDYGEEDYAKALVSYANGRISLLAASRTPDGAYTPDLTDGIDADCLLALTKANDLANTFAQAQMPLRVLIEGRNFLFANKGDLKDLTSYTLPRAGIVLMSSASDGSSSVGYALGVAAGLPCQRKISRVKNGAISLTQAYIGDTAVEDFTASDLLHDMHYIILRTFPTKTGFFFNSDLMAAPNTDDYSMLARGRVIDKAQRITYNTYVEELDDEVETEGGKLKAGFVAYLQSKVEQQIATAMADNIDGVSAFIDPDQAVLTTNKTNIVLKLVPKGYNGTIEVELGFALSI